MDQVIQEKRYTNPSDLYTDPHINFLLKSIEDPGVMNFLINDFLVKMGNDPDPELISEGRYSKTVDYFRQNSLIASAIMENPSTSVVTEILYEQTSQTLVDEYFIKSNAGDAIHDRLGAVIENLNGLVESVLEKKGKATIINLGSGPGRDTIYMIKNSEMKNYIHITCIDKDEKALENGYTMAKYLGVAKHIDFQKVDLIKALNPRHKKFGDFHGQYDIGMLVGIICPLSMKNSKMIVKIGKHVLSDGGTLITSAAHKRMKKGDPFTDYLMKRLSEWELCYKTAADMEQIYMDSGLDVTWIRYDKPLRYHILAAGKRKEGASFC